MPKMKSHSGAKKRFKLTGKGKVKARHAMTSHNLGKKDAKRKRRLGNPTVLEGQDAARARKLLRGGSGKTS
jgi:large subunit ribosomal protein L35